ncbi:hypothetical protein RSOLAG22IIIB_08398 [Rhizoctonia solani]|uniref:Uncharacterized protein n=1 Tax=Rhizoctonia solani TaxID=456999 RepID=A0A0K6FTD3_9AGAM|nr:hypothetical protein RSOLAG22IIIB_08398 [Rhizoctonia solani]
MFFYTVPASAMPWYQYSLSFALYQIAHSSIISQVLSSALKDTSGHVFTHESYFNQVYIGARSPRHDPTFVYDGYLTALGNLLNFLTQPGYMHQDAHVYMEIDGHLRNLLLIAHSRCASRVPLDLINDREWNLFLADFMQVLKP